MQFKPRRQFVIVGALLGKRSVVHHHGASSWCIIMVHHLFVCDDEGVRYRLHEALLCHVA
jgi:hypothetical protein